MVRNNVSNKQSSRTFSQDASCRWVNRASVWSWFMKCSAIAVHVLRSAQGAALFSSKWFSKCSRLCCAVRTHKKNFKYCMERCCEKHMGMRHENAHACMCARRCGWWGSKIFEPFLCYQNGNMFILTRVCSFMYELRSWASLYSVPLSLRTILCYPQKPPDTIHWTCGMFASEIGTTCQLQSTGFI